LLSIDFIPAGNKDAPLLTSAFTAPESRAILPWLFKVCFNQCFFALIISLSAAKQVPGLCWANKELNTSLFLMMRLCLN
jgi:hypothetical protein